MNAPFKPECSVIAEKGRVFSQRLKKRKERLLFTYIDLSRDLLDYTLIDHESKAPGKDNESHPFLELRYQSQPIVSQVVSLRAERGVVFGPAIRNEQGVMMLLFRARLDHGLSVGSPEP